MLSLREYINLAKENKTAIGHFNACTLDGIWAIADAGLANGNKPIIVGFSEGERDYVGVRQAVAIVRSIREEREQPIFLNADHSYSFERVCEAIDAGFDSVIFDGAKLSLEENISITKKCVAYARDSGRDVVVEGELGYIGSSSKVLDAIPDGAVSTKQNMTSVEDAKRFIAETGVDLFAPAVGNIHGILKSGEPALNISRIKEISSVVGLSLVLHGASGNSDSDIREAIKAGVTIVHVNTELRLAYRAGLVKALSDDPEEISPYKYLKSAKLAMQKVIEEKLNLLSLA